MPRGRKITLFVYECKAKPDGEDGDTCNYEFMSNVQHTVCPSCGVEDRLEMVEQIESSI